MFRMRVSQAVLLSLFLTGCTAASDEAGGPSPTAPGTTVSEPPANVPTTTSGAATASTSPVESTTASPTPTVAPSSLMSTSPAAASAQQTQTPQPTMVTASPSSRERPKPKVLRLGMGETASLAYFDVTVKRFRFGSSGDAQAGFLAKVCYTHPHPDANADGTTRVSRNPWSVAVLDLEGAAAGDQYEFHRVDEFDPATWDHAYRERKIRVGECNEGWIAWDTHNPDLATASIRYNPKDFGDKIIWKIS